MALYDEQRVEGDEAAAETTTSTTFVDIADASITVNTSTGQRVLVGFVAKGFVNSSAEHCFTINVDGTDIGGTTGLVCANDSAANAVHNYSFTYLSDELSGGSHTFKARHRVSGSTGTIYNTSTYTYELFTKVQN